MTAETRLPRNRGGTDSAIKVMDTPLSDYLLHHHNVLSLKDVCSFLLIHFFFIKIIIHKESVGMLVDLFQFFPVTDFPNLKLRQGHTVSWGSASKECPLLSSNCCVQEHMY